MVTYEKFEHTQNLWTMTRREKIVFNYSLKFENIAWKYCLVAKLKCAYLFRLGKSKGEQLGKAPFHQHNVRLTTMQCDVLTSI